MAGRGRGYPVTWTRKSSQSSRPDGAPGPRTSSLRPSQAYVRLRDRVAASIGQFALHQLRECGPARQPTRQELVRLLGSHDMRVREMAGLLAVRAGAS
jgi:hypothetical protein